MGEPLTINPDWLSRTEPTVPVALIRQMSTYVVIAGGAGRDPDQAWFWTEEWQEKHRQAEEEHAAGLGTVYLDPDDFLREIENL